MDDYEMIFKWLKKATKAERHIEEMESFAKQHPILFMKFHTMAADLIKQEEGSEAYNKTKDKLSALFEAQKEAFEPMLRAITIKFSSSNG